MKMKNKGLTLSFKSALRGENCLLQVKRTFEAYLDEMNLITILIPKSYFQGVVNTFTLENERGEKRDLPIERKVDFPAFLKYECRINFPIEIGGRYTIYEEHGAFTDLQIGAVTRTIEFDNNYYYDGDDLGITYREHETIFKLWAPTATEVKLKLWKENEESQLMPMARQEKGVWTISVAKNLEGYYYTYLVCVNLVWREAVDPYAIAVSVNGEYGVIVDLTKTRLSKPVLPPLSSPADAIIYEMHIRDFTIHPESGIMHKGKYLGLSEQQTTGPNGTSTGLSYLKELGITHVELLPFNDFAGVDERNPDKDYNWGYNPLHYNAPEGSYATDPVNPYVRIYELKHAIKTLQENGIRVIMDVVYNHVYIREQSSFEKIVPGYYFRYDAYGMPANGTGVGNDFASERKMARKFIIDSVRFWLREYHVDGFRFDLMGILDVNTMKEIRKTADAIDPSILIIGEGWDLNTPLPPQEKANMQNAEKMPRIAHFNDRFRDYVKGSTFNLYDRGFALGSRYYREEVKQAIAGSIDLGTGKKGLFKEPIQTINYVESHDNRTFWDKAAICNAFESEEIRKKRQKLATSIVLLSQGIPFLHSGQEFYRTKQGVENSYNSPDVINQLDWRRKSEHEKDVRYIQGLIALRKYHGAFRLATADEIRAHMIFFENVPESMIMYQLCDVNKYGPWNDILIIHHNEEKNEIIALPDADVWHVVCDSGQSGVQSLYSVNKHVQIFGIATFVLYKK
jgi:pullulanase